MVIVFFTVEPQQQGLPDAVSASWEKHETAGEPLLTCMDVNGGIVGQFRASLVLGFYVQKKPTTNS
jgi:hypothetical protein